jgi:atypical dual specificity phosphatase
LHGVDWGPLRRGFAHVLGPPGAGKTMLLRALARHHLGDGVRFWGQIVYGGVDWRVCAPAAFADPRPPLPTFDVATNLLAALPAERLLALLESSGSEASAAGRAWAGEWLRRHQAAGLPPDAPVAALDAAARRRLAIARALVASPPLVLVDDADTVAGDGDALRLLGRAASERLVVLASRSARLAAALGGDTLRLADGTTRERGEARAFAAGPATEGGAQFVATGRCPPPPSGPPLDVAPPMGFRWVLPGRLAGMSRPGLVSELDEHLATLRRLGVSTVVTLEEAPVNAEALRAAGLEQVHFPIVDMAAPEAGPTARLCEAIWARARAGAAVAVHCKAGLGRTGTVLAACLMVGGHNAAQAIELLRQLHPQFVQSEAQLAFVHGFGERAATRRGGGP